jgi:hypothetical protein
MFVHLAKALCFVAFAVFTANVAVAQSTEARGSHEAATIRLGKALRVEEGFARGVEDGVRRVAGKNPTVIAQVLECAESMGLEKRLFSEWVRIHATHISETDATGIATYFESPGGVKLILGIRACSSSPSGSTPCNPLMTLSERHRNELAAFERSRPAATFNRVQSVAQRELEASSKSLVSNGIDVCVKAQR